MSDKTIATIEERLTTKAIGELAKALRKAIEGYATAFAPYMGYGVADNRAFETRTKGFNEAFGKIVADAVTLRLSYHCGYSTRLDTQSSETMEVWLHRNLPQEVLDAIRSSASANFLAKVEEIGEIAIGTAEAVDSINRS